MSKTALFLHVVWTTYRRRPIIPSLLEGQIHRTIEAKCAELRCSVIAIGGTDDHVHMLMRLHPTVPLSRVVGEAKGLSSHLMSHDLQRGRFFGWQDGYYGASISREDLSSVVEYILDQKSHHAENQVLGHLEPPEAPEGLGLSVPWPLWPRPPK
jgi:REP element-mobilizing transposase RayT